MSTAVCGELPKKKKKDPSAKSIGGRAVAPFQSYRGYQTITKRSGGYKCKHLLQHAFPDLPAEFYWANLDRTGLMRYIDRLYLSDFVFCRQCEDDGRVTNVSYPVVENAEKRPDKTINVKRLFDCLQLVDTMNVPLWNRAFFVTDGNYLVPRTYIAELVRFAPDRFGHLDPNREWREATVDDLRAMNLRPEQVTSGLYLDHKPKTPVNGKPMPTPPAYHAQATAKDMGRATPQTDDVTEQDSAAPPPRERTVSRREHDEYTDWTTQVIPDDGRPWYTRRLYREGRVFYSATSWERDGPWTVWERDNAELLALGLDL